MAFLCSPINLLRGAGARDVGRFALPSGMAESFRVGPDGWDGTDLRNDCFRLCLELGRPERARSQTYFTRVWSGARLSCASGYHFTHAVFSLGECAANRLRKWIAACDRIHFARVYRGEQLEPLAQRGFTARLSQSCFEIFR
jgi:hypothetical protein